MELFNNLRKIVLVVEYNGKCYYGFQWQKGLPTIQDELEKAIYKLTSDSRRVLAACRTDTGVHAKGQVVTFRTSNMLPPQVLSRGLNHFLPGDIAVTGAGNVGESFNVMKDAISREYRYQILNRKSRSPLAGDFYFQFSTDLNVDLMDKASQILIGEHDFASFATSWDRKGSTIRHIYEAGVRKDGERVTFRVVANSFLTHQVRNMAGSLIRVGISKIGLDEFHNVLESKKLGLAGPMAPAKGLCLMKVIYTENSEFKYENLCT